MLSSVCSDVSTDSMITSSLLYAIATTDGTILSKHALASLSKMIVTCIFRQLYDKPLWEPIVSDIPLVVGYIAFAFCSCNQLAPKDKFQRHIEIRVY